MQRFLEYTVAETLAGRSGKLSEYTIGMAVFDRGESFEPNLDPIVRNEARRLRHKLLEYYQQPHPQSRDELVIDIPKGHYVPVFRPIVSFAPARIAVLPFEALPAGAETSLYSHALSSSISTELSRIEGLELVAVEEPQLKFVSNLNVMYVVHGRRAAT